MIQKRESFKDQMRFLFILVKSCIIVLCILITLYIIRKSIDIKKAMAFTGNRSKSSIGISLFKVKRLFSG